MFDFELGEFKINFNPSQKEFFSKVDKGRYCGFGGGYGNGKTLSACIQIARLAGRYSNNLILVGRLKGTDLENSTKKTMLELMAPWLETGQATYKTKENKIVLENGTEILFRHLEEVYSSGISGMNLGYFYLDQAEEIEESVFELLAGRLRRVAHDLEGNEAPRGGIITFNMSGHNWIWRLFKKHWNKDKTPLVNPEEYTLIEASTVDNAKHLPEDYLKDLLAHDAEWVARWVYGSWDVFSGQIFDDFNPEKHVIPHRDPKPGSIIFCAIDPGFVDPFAVLWLAIEPGGGRYVFMEHYIAGQTTEWHAEVIKQKEGGRRIAARFVDAQAAQVITDLNAKGIYCIPAKKETLQSSKDLIGGGIQQIKDLLRFDPITDKPGMIISDNCINLIYELQQYSWKPRRGALNAPEVPEDKNNHAVDALRYILINYFPETRTATRPNRGMASARDLIVSH